MAKKSRPSRAASAPSEASAISSAVQPKAQKVLNFADEYFYVFQDLRHMALISVSMLVILFALSFIVR
jgi:hypothetical protein